MRLVDFLILLLEAHAETLKRLAAFFGEDAFLEILENSGSDEPKVPELDRKFLVFDPVQGSSANGRSPYVELEGAVREFNLPAVLEFHLWAYPQYRAFIESELELDSILRSENESVAIVLVDETIQQARSWVHQLPIPPTVSLQAEAAANLPWIRFRNSALRKMGLRPIGPVA